jgi:two-component system, NarL family, sensor histidine kinase DesK
VHVARMARDGVPFGPNRHVGWRRWAGTAFGMLWLLIPIADLAQSDPSPGHVALAVVGSVTFVGFYLGRAMRWPSSDRETLVTVGTMALVATVLTVFERSTWGLLFVYTAAAGGLRLPPNRNAVAVVGSTALCVLTMSISETDAGTIVSISATTLGIGVLFMALGGVIRANIELREARAELAELAVAEERLRFARDLHDLLGQSLSLIALKAQLAGRLLPDRPEEASKHIADLQDVSREALREVREAVAGYRSPTLSGELAGARVALEAAGIDAQFVNPEVALPPAVEAVLAWAVREGATNVIRHSGAQHATIRIRPGMAAASAEILDDGAGAAPSGSDTGNGTVAGHGLTGLRERVQGLGGELDAGPRAGGGFRLSVSVPVEVAET